MLGLSCLWQHVTLNQLGEKEKKNESQIIRTHFGVYMIECGNHKSCTMPSNYLRKILEGDIIKETDKPGCFKK